MQFYRDGFRPGDPRVHDAVHFPDHSAEEVDVLIVGSGPAGNLLAAQLAQFPEIHTRLIERRSGPLELGQADGVSCRTVETFEAFGLASPLLSEAYWVNETSFWRPDTENRTAITRTGRIQDVEDGLSEFPHLIVNQARIHDLLLEAMKRSPSRLVPDYGLEFLELTVTPGEPRPVAARVREIGTGTEHVIRAKYVVGTDGARSGVRAAIGQRLAGAAAGHAWGVVDLLPDTDFPDIRLKAAIQSADAGSVLLIPREGGYLVRLYVDLGEVTDDNRAEVRAHSAEDILAIANRVLQPYTLASRETVWWSIYEVAQRVAARFDDAVSDREPQVFIAGDACHTHSAKAGQGMNVSMQDTLNLGWKLAAVLRDLAPADLLRTYTDERQPVARELIDFDREWSAMMAAGPVDPEHPERGGVDPRVLEDFFTRAGRYTAGLGTRYPASRLTGTGSRQHLAPGFEVGTRFHSHPVTRIADAKHLELGHLHRADGRFRLYLFADREELAFRRLCDWLEQDPASPIRRHTPEGWDIDGVIDVRGILQRPHRDATLAELPPLLRPRTGRYGLVDQEKAFSGLTRDGSIFTARRINSDEGAAVVVRPDQYIADVVALSDTNTFADIFARVFRDQA